MAKLDPELETEAEFIGGDKDDPDRIVDSEALGARHRRRFGYSAEGAEENDHDINAKGRNPLKVSVNRSAVPESRMHAFTHGHSPGVTHITTVKKR
jgi:hypothetical protein